MSSNKSVPWEIAEHTSAKHQIYRLYLDRWFPILLSNNGYPSATYAEGFAGPGVYIGGEPGSPIIAIDTLLKRPELKNSSKPTRFVFIDNDERCVDMLKEQIVARFPVKPRPDLMRVAVREGTCAEILESTLDEVNAWGNPILAVLDSFGNAPVPHRFIRRLAKNPSSEVIVTLTPGHFIRFVTDMGRNVDDVFGGDPAWRKVNELSNGEAKRRFLLTQYRKMLQRAGFRYLLDFEMIDRRGNALYLVFGTTHTRGLQKMKESVWEVDPRFGVQFRDPRDEQDEALFAMEDPQDAPLQRLLLERLRNGEVTAVAKLREFALYETVYKESHVLTALRKLLEVGAIHAEDPGPLRLGGKVCSTPSA